MPCQDLLLFLLADDLAATALFLLDLDFILPRPRLRLIFVS